MEEHFSEFQASAQSASDILFPLLLWYLEFLLCISVCVIFLMVWKTVHDKHGKG
jgi:hypothetical protein